MMENKDMIVNCSFYDNKYSCGHETIHNCIANMSPIPVTAAEVYFLANVIRFEMFDNDISVGYNGLNTIFQGIKTNITRAVRLKYVDDEECALEDIKENLMKNRLIILYLKAEGLYYHSISQKRYPYHMVICYGYNEVTGDLFIADLCVNDDNKVSSLQLEADYESIIRNTKEYLIFEENNDKSISFCRESIVSVVKNELALYLKHQHKIIINYLNQLPNTEHEYQANSIIAFKWVIIIPLLCSLRDFIQERNICLTNVEKLNNLIANWETEIYRVIKNVYKRRNTYENIDIEDLDIRTHQIINLIMEKLDYGSY